MVSSLIVAKMFDLLSDQPTDQFLKKTYCLIIVSRLSWNNDE